MLNTTASATVSRTTILGGVAGLALLAGCTVVSPDPTNVPSAEDESSTTSPEETSPADDAEVTSAGDDAASTTSAMDTLARIDESGTLRVCTTGDYRPYTYLDPDTDQWSGIDVTMAEQLAKELGADLELVQTSWKELIPDLSSRCDIAMGGISFNEERAKLVDFSTATVQDGKAPIARCSDVDKFQTIEDINAEGVKVITPIGGTNEKFAEENFPDAEIITWDDNNTIFDQIIAKDADVMVTDASETKWVAHEHEGDLCAINPDEPFTEFENGYLLPKGDTAWQSRVNEWLEQALTDGTYAAAEKPWFG